MTTYHHDNAAECFEHAIFNRVLSDSPAASNFAGHFMYMYSDERHDHFKHITTRRYVKSSLIC